MGKHMIMDGKDMRTLLERTTFTGDLTVDVRSLIEFFDVNTDARQDASSIKAILGEELAVACMMRYFQSKGQRAELLTERLAPSRRLPCTTGGRKGFQLDGWFVVEKDRVRDCYQTEIKSWSFHGIGGRDQRLLIEGEENSKTLAQKRYIFSRYYDARSQSLIHSGTKKVLLQMRQPQAPKKMPQYPTESPKPLLCLWAPVCRADSDRSEIFFRVPIASFEPLKKENGAICAPGGFTEVNVFSVSNYLRAALNTSASSGGPQTISLPLPRIAERIRLLSAIFS